MEVTDSTNRWLDRRQSFAAASACTILLGLVALKIALGHDPSGKVGVALFYAMAVVEGLLAAMVAHPRWRRNGMVGTLTFGVATMGIAVIQQVHYCGCFGKGVEIGWRGQAAVGCLLAAASSYWILARRGHGEPAVS